MHESESTLDRVDAGENTSGTDASASPDVRVPATGRTGELTVLERLEAFRHLIRQGNSLLGEVVVHCREAEIAVTQLAAEKADLDRLRVEVEEARSRAESEAAAARNTLAQLDAQRCELESMRRELMAARSDVVQFHQTQNESAAALERSLKEARQQQHQLEQELQRVRAQAASSRSIDTRLGELDEMEAKLRVAERELVETRRALEEERNRRDRAIALIRPKPVAAEVHP